MSWMSPRLEVVPAMGTITIDLYSKQGMTINWDPLNKSEPFEYMRTDGTLVHLYQDNQLVRTYYVLNLSRLEQIFCNIVNYIKQQQEKYIFDTISLEYVCEMCCLSFILQDLT